MSGNTVPAPTAPGWYPDPETGGTRYSDGSRWTGDVRPRRRPFAASSWMPEIAIIATVLPGFFSLMSIGAYSESRDGFWVLFGVVMAIVAGVVGVYLFRGRGPSTQSVEARLAHERKEARAKRRAANIAGFAAGLGGLFQPRAAASAQPTESAAVAQINALANPETATALQNLESLLYTRVLTQDEFQAAKDRVLVNAAHSDAHAQLEKLAELHEAGVLGDVEFAAAKSRVLGLS